MGLITPPLIGKRSIVMSVSVCLCVRDDIFETTRPIVTKCFALVTHTMAVARSSYGGVVIRYVLPVPVLSMTSYLLISHGCSTSPPS